MLGRAGAAQFTGRGHALAPCQAEGVKGCERENHWLARQLTHSLQEEEKITEIADWPSGGSDTQARPVRCPDRSVIPTRSRRAGEIEREGEIIPPFYLQHSNRFARRGINSKALLPRFDIGKHPQISWLFGCPVAQFSAHFCLLTGLSR